MSPFKPVYCAGPFFNEEQRAHMARIENSFRAAKVPFFSPRQQPTNTKSLALISTRQEILQMNADNILKASFVFAALDWLLPPGQTVRVVREPGSLVDPSYSVPVSGPLSLPDTGTIWEIGYAYALKVPIVGFLLERKGKFNLMLTETLKGLVYGYDGLEKFAHLAPDLESKPMKNFLEAWKGDAI